MRNKKPIGIFDSGVGGLSVLREIKKILPAESLIFLADQKNVPYGKKTQQQLKKITENITRFLLNHDIKLLVVACNTATCYALQHLRATFDIPIVGVVPAIKPAARKTRKSKIAVMSTPATAKSTYLKDLIKDYASDSKVLRIGCDGLEEQVEDLDYSGIEKSLKKSASKVIDFGADVVVLGCTHYPLIKERIQKNLHPKIAVIDSGKAVAQRVRFILTKNRIISSQKVSEIYFTTADPTKFSKVASALLESKIKAQKVVL